MSTIVSHIVRGLAWLLVAAIVAQIYFAGAFVFGALSVEWHRAVGFNLLPATLLTALVSLTTRETRRASSKKLFALLGLLVVQLILVIVRPKFPAVSALHAVNAVVLLWHAHRVARAAHVPSRLPAPVPAVASVQPA